MRKADHTLTGIVYGSVLSIALIGAMFILVTRC